MASRIPSLAAATLTRRSIQRAAPQLRTAFHRSTAAPVASYATSGSGGSKPFQSGPAPPRLPAEEQAEFERLQRVASTHEGPLAEAIEAANNAAATATAAATAVAAQSVAAAAAVAVALDGEPADPNANPALRRGAPPEFEGDVNPKTGEVGGPKNEPLRWGPQGDWSFNGRVTDF
ncbi:hypothetical protein BX600DRAFT_476258 [Xylariales sp. PMI_506]|nr:hypothetical protein BX600DRAFT_476258 [Xylariales sp. PMI_506]